MQRRKEQVLHPQVTAANQAEHCSLQDLSFGKDFLSILDKLKRKRGLFGTVITRLFLALYKNDYFHILWLIQDHQKQLAVVVVLNKWSLTTGLRHQDDVVAPTSPSQRTPRKKLVCVCQGRAGICSLADSVPSFCHPLLCSW